MEHYTYRQEYLLKCIINCIGAKIERNVIEIPETRFTELLVSKDW